MVLIRCFPRVHRNKSSRSNNQHNMDDWKVRLRQHHLPWFEFLVTFDVFASWYIPTSNGRHTKSQLMTKMPFLKKRETKIGIHVKSSAKRLSHTQTAFTPPPPPPFPLKILSSEVIIIMSFIFFKPRFQSQFVAVKLKICACRSQSTNQEGVRFAHPTDLCFSICSFSRVVFIPRAQPHPPSYFSIFNSFCY